MRIILAVYGHRRGFGRMGLGIRTREGDLGGSRKENIVSGVGPVVRVSLAEAGGHVYGDPGEVGPVWH